MAALKREIRMNRGEFAAVMLFLVFLPMLAGLAALDHNRSEGLKAEQKRSSQQLARSQAADAWSRYDDAFKACQRGRELREQQNDNNDATKAIAFLVASVFNDAALHQLEMGDPERARELRQGRDQITAAALKLEDLTQPVCKAVIRKPAVPRPGS